MRFIKEFLKNNINDAAFKYQTTLIRYGDKKAFDLIGKIRKETEFLMETYEAYMLYALVKATSNITGDIAEVGVYKGGSAKLICETKNNNKAVYLFDTFEGLPKTHKLDESFEEGQYKADFQEVKKYLKKYNKTYVFKGEFPKDNSDKIKDKTFSFVNLDADLYESILYSLKFFYPRLSQGGIILFHDTTIKGFNKVLELGLGKNPYIFIELSRRQGCIVKV
jgi:O-methyltransferase